MNKQYVNTIFKILSSGIDKGYKAGIKSIVALNRKKFTEGKVNRVEFADKNIYSVNYTATDKKAIENYKISVFKMACVGSYELEEELKQLGVDYKENKFPDVESYELQVRQKFLKYGIGLGDQPPSGWIKQSLDMSVKSSIQGARWNRVNDPELKGLYSHWIYKTQNDIAVRPAHQQLEGNVYAMSDKAASKLIPPNDFGCRCYQEFITRDESKEHEIKDGSEDLKNVPENFRHNPGNGVDIFNQWLEEKFKDMPEGELKKLEKLLSERF